MMLLVLAQTPSPPPGDTTGWPLLLLMAAAALVVGGVSFLFLARRWGSDLFGERRRGDDPNRPRANS